MLGIKIVTFFIFFTFFTFFTLLVTPAARPENAIAPFGLNEKNVPRQSGWALSQIAARGTRTASDRSVIVAVIDTGGDVTHADLRTAVWTNFGETGTDSNGQDRSLNQIDDDRNGFVDDVHGWNFVDDSPDPVDQHGHGTHVSGIIHQVAPEAKLMILKYFDPHADAESGMLNTVHAIDYAIRMGAHVINYSAGGPSASPAEAAAILRARSHGILFVTAAGNEGTNADVRPYFPASYAFDNILSVTAIDRRYRPLPTSNVGISSVQIAAPGERIWSSLPGGRYGQMTGTSQATAFASGAAAYLLSQSEQRLTPSECISRLVAAGVSTPHLVGRTRGGSALHLARAISMHGPDRRTTNLMTIDPIFFSPSLSAH